MSLNLTQNEADALIAMPKQPADNLVRKFPSIGERIIVPLESTDRTEDFLLDVSRSRIDFSQITYQNRGRQVVVLMRLDLNGPPHRNPDGIQIPCPHMHLYREGFGDKWAYPLPAGAFTNLNDLRQTLSDFLTRCNVVSEPILEMGLF